MTTPQTFSPNVRILTPEASLPADAPKSDNPLAEAALAELLQGGRLGIRDMYKRTEGENPEWDYADALRAGLGSLDRHVADLEREGHAAVGEWWQGVRSRVWYGVPPLPADPGAHPYPEAAPVAEPEPELTAAALEPLPGLKSPELPVVPPAEPEPAAGEPAPPADATAVLLSMAKPEEEGEPADATTVMPVAEEETQIVPAVEDGASHE